MKISSEDTKFWNSLGFNKFYLIRNIKTNKYGPHIYLSKKWAQEIASLLKYYEVEEFDYYL